jgi:hypothetical protein
MAVIRVTNKKTDLPDVIRVTVSNNAKTIKIKK